MAVLWSHYAIHNWMLILSKLVRAMYDPTKVDTWADIAGYATLMKEYLEGDEDG